MSVCRSRTLISTRDSSRVWSAVVEAVQDVAVDIDHRGS